MSLESLIITGLIVTSALMVAVFLIPGGKTKRAKKKKIPSEPEADHTACEEKRARLEHHIQSLKAAIEKSEKAEKAHDKELMVERVKVKKLQEKLTQERQWHEKEQDGIDKKSREFREIKEELSRVQEQYSKAHSSNLRLDKQVKALQEEIEGLNGQRRRHEEEISRLNTQAKSDRQDIARLEKENRELTRKKEDASWVAKTEYERVSRLLKEKEKELERAHRKPQE